MTADSSVESQFPPDDARDEATARIRAVDEREDTASEIVTAIDVRGGLDRVGVGGPHVGARDLISVALDEPAKGREASLNGKWRILLDEVTCSTGQRSGIRTDSHYPRSGSGGQVTTAASAPGRCVT